MSAKEWADKFRELAVEMEREIGITKVTIEKRLSADYSDTLCPIAKEDFRVEITYSL